MGELSIAIADDNPQTLGRLQDILVRILRLVMLRNHGLKDVI